MDSFSPSCLVPGVEHPRTFRVDFEIMFGSPPPMYKTLESWARSDDSFIPSSSLLACLKALEIVRKEVWEWLKDTYAPGDTAVPHKFEVRDAVLLQRHRTGILSQGGQDPHLGSRLPWEGFP